VNFKKIVILCSRSARSSAYVQAMNAAGIVPYAVIVYGDIQAPIKSNRDLSVCDLGDIYCPDVSLDVVTLVKNYHWSLSFCNESELDSIALHQLLNKLDPDLIIYSGSGGQIVPESMLSYCSILHVHSGWLPDYRGSTTIYHEFIEHQQCSASALFLDKGIDTGPILTRKKYPLPPPGIDVDYLYDNAIRADVLVEVIKATCLSSEKLPTIEKEKEHSPYFIIHPLLKHIALLGADAKGAKP